MVPVPRALNMESEMFVLFHVPSGLYADQISVEADGTINTCGIAYLDRCEAAGEIESIARHGGIARDWSVVAMPENVHVQWVV